MKNYDNPIQTFYKLIEKKLRIENLSWQKQKILLAQNEFEDSKNLIGFLPEDPETHTFLSIVSMEKQDVYNYDIPRITISIELSD